MGDDLCITGLLNTEDRRNTIRVDSKVVRETDTGHARSDETRYGRMEVGTRGVGVQ